MSLVALRDDGREVAYKRKITPEQELEIRERYQAGETGQTLAAEYGLTAKYIRSFFGPRHG